LATEAVGEERGTALALAMSARYRELLWKIGPVLISPSIRENKVYYFSSLISPSVQGNNHFLHFKSGRTTNTTFMKLLSH
jgi:hypothetical protein